LLSSPDNSLAQRVWPVKSGKIPRAVVVLVHGLGEHSKRYTHVAKQLNDWGFSVVGYDLYGHGKSPGPRGAMISDKQPLDDLAGIIDQTRKTYGETIPLVLLGHSMGGLIAARFVSLELRPVQALVLSSPALDAGLSAFKRFLLLVLPKIVPDLRAGNGLKSAYVSHDAAVVQAYRLDPMVHDRISARLAKFIADQGAATIAAAPEWKTPTLLMYAGQDKLVNPKGSVAFAAAAPKEVVTTRCFDNLYHEIFNEIESQPVFKQLKSWLDSRF
jgi:alpha-beta hydrolase superfamily lysophospholipase